MEGDNIEQATSYASIVGLVIRSKREERGMTRKAFSEAISFSVNWCTQIESGQVFISIDRLRRVASFFESSVQKLIDEVDSIKAQLEKEGLIVYEEVLPKEQDVLQSKLVSYSKGHTGAIAGGGMACSMSSSSVAVRVIGGAIDGLFFAKRTLSYFTRRSNDEKSN